MKNCVLLTSAGWRMQLFQLIFMQPMGSNIFSPSTCNCVRLCLDIINPAKMSKLLLKMSGQEIKWERPNGEQGKGHRDWNEAVLTYNRDGVLRFNDRGIHRCDVCVNFWIPYPYAHNTGFAKEILLPLSHLAIGAAHEKQIRQIWKHNPPT